MEGPIAVFEVRLIEHLRSVGYAPETVNRKLRLVGKLSRFLLGTGRSVGDLRRPRSKPSPLTYRSRHLTGSPQRHWFG